MAPLSGAAPRRSRSSQPSSRATRRSTLLTSAAKVSRRRPTSSIRVPSAPPQQAANRHNRAECQPIRIHAGSVPLRQACGRRFKAGLPRCAIRSLSRLICSPWAFMRSRRSQSQDGDSACALRAPGSARCRTASSRRPASRCRTGGTRWRATRDCEGRTSGESATSGATCGRWANPCATSRSSSPRWTNGC